MKRRDGRKFIITADQLSAAVEAILRMPTSNVCYLRPPSGPDSGKVTNAERARARRVAIAAIRAYEGLR